MATMFRGVLVVALLLSVACIEDDTISHVSQTTTVASKSDGPTTYRLDIEFTMPKSFPVQISQNITMTDTAGREFVATETHFSTSFEGVQKVSAKFDVAENSKFGVIHVGHYDVDVPSRHVTRRGSA